MYRTQGVLALLALYLGWAHCFSWDVVVGGDRQLQFYDSNGTRTHIEDIPAERITSLAYDPVHNCVLFADYSDKIASFNIATRKIIVLVSGASQSYARIAYDPITSLLFWNERSGNRDSIYSKGYSSAGDQNLVIKLDGYELIYCITVDSSRGYIYWTTSSKIERARLDGSERQVLIDEKVYWRTGIAIDQQTQKMYWIENMYTYDGRAFQRTESADLNGENRRTLYNRQQQELGGALVVSKDFIYWKTDNTISQFTRNPLDDKEVKPKKFLLAGKSFYMAMASNYKIEDQTQGIQNCISQKRLNVSTDVSLLCVNGTKVSGESRCECAQGYIGERCDVSVCHNYCFQGDCSVSAEGQPKCRCNASYSGERCEVSVCDNYCFQGDCSASTEGQLMCRCKPGYSGERCEVNACHEYCSNNGVCVLNEESQPVCQCTGGYEGERCNVSVCQNYCFQGDCSASAEGQLMCRCKAGYFGERCEVNACHEYCSNNGVCVLNEESEPFCQCTGGYEGERCNVSVCQNYCFEGDCSVSAEGQPKCRCKPGYFGERCEVSSCHEYCLNNGVCVLNEESEPFCQCTGGYEGERCNVSVCQNYCFQGDCSVSAQGQPKCRCNAGYSGERCEVNAFSTPTIVTGAASYSTAIQELNNTLKGWRIDMDHAMAKLPDDIIGTLRGLREEMEIIMSKLNGSIKCITLSDMKQEMNTLRSEFEKLKENDCTVAHDVSGLKSSAQIQTAEQKELQGHVDNIARKTPSQQPRVKIYSKQRPRKAR